MSLAEASAAEVEEEEHLSPHQASMHDAAMESLDSIQSGLVPDPDSASTVTDFLEFTEHLPADMMRSLTLIGKLDCDYADASNALHELTKLWGQLPSLPANDKKPQAVRLRADIADEVGRAYNSRLLSHAEALRSAETVNRHYNRLMLITAKLRNMYENYPAEDETNKSPVATARSPQATRSNKRQQPAGGDKGRRPRGPRITVPGEVLAPYEVGLDTVSGESDSSEDEEQEEEVVAPMRTPAAARAGSQKPRSRKAATEKIPKTPKAPKLKVPKASAPQGPSPAAENAAPGMPSVTTPLRPPPEDAMIGSEHKPWLQLTQYELAKLRKRMKKNSSWVPSETMVNRELKTLGRGYHAWSSAKKQAEEEGLAFEPTLPQLIVDDTTGSEHLPMGAVTMSSAIAAEDKTLTNRGHELNKAKKIKKDRLSDQAAREAEESAKRFAQLARNFHQVSFQPSQPSSQPQAKNTKRQQKKRKRNSVSEADAEKPDPAGLKRSKTETPVPIPQHINLPRHPPAQPPQLTPGGTQVLHSTTPVPIPVPSQDQSIMVGAKSSGAASPDPSADAGTTTTVVPTKAPADLNTPILPPGRETRAREARTKEKAAAPPPIKTTGSRGNTPSVITPATETPSSRRPGSRGQAAGHESGQQQKPGLAAERPRRASTARNTPAPEPSLRQTSKRTKRPAPGIISRTSSGGNNSAITKRKAAPKKSKRGSGGAHKKERGQTAEAEAEAEVEVDEEGNVIDPNEARYCLCNRVSFGTMVQCENDSVSQVCARTARTFDGGGNIFTDWFSNSASTSGSTSSAWESTAPQYCLRFGTAKTVGFFWDRTRRARGVRGRRDEAVRDAAIGCSLLSPLLLQLQTPRQRGFPGLRDTYAHKDDALRPKESRCVLSRRSWPQVVLMLHRVPRLSVRGTPDPKSSRKILNLKNRLGVCMLCGKLCRRSRPCDEGYGFYYERTGGKVDDVFFRS